MDTYRAVVALWTALVLVPGTSLGGPQSPPPATTVVQGDVVHVWDRTPTRYVARQIYEYPDTSALPPPQVDAGPVPVFEPPGTTGWVPVVPPTRWHLRRPDVPVTVPRPHYGPTTVVYPMEKPLRNFAQEPLVAARPKSDGLPQRVGIHDGQTDSPTWGIVAPPAAKRNTHVSAVAEKSTDATRLETTTDATSPTIATTTEQTYAPSKVTVTEREETTSEINAIDATSMPTDVRTVVTTADDAGGREYALASGAVAGIVVGAISLVALVTGLATYVILRRPFLKLNGNAKSSAENVAYIDDSFRSGYVNAHVELPKESSEEMTSLDNDSFLNSLEAVTIQNYWADGSGHTKNTIV